MECRLNIVLQLSVVRRSVKKSQRLCCLNHSRHFPVVKQGGGDLLAKPHPFMCGITAALTIPKGVIPVTGKTAVRKKRTGQNRMIFHAMLFLPCLFLLIFNYLPIAGIVMAFQDFHPADVREHFIEEMCDTLMYFNDVMLCYGITPEELKKVYLDKHKKNMNRW